MAAFQKITKTSHPPAKNILVYDGDCSFCKFWVNRWKRGTGNKINYRPYQEVAQDFSDIPKARFQEASRLIETDGSVFSGPDSAYRSLWHSGNKKWHRWYNGYALFRWLSDVGYGHIAGNRGFYWKVTKLLFGAA